MTRHLAFTVIAAGLLAAPSPSQAQNRDVFTFGPSNQFEFVVSKPLADETVVKNAPFSAEAVNEFTQVLGDGNRIERRFTTSMWRDSQGRTRREEQIALVGPLAVQGNPPTLVTISDPVAGVSYTLDERTKTATSQTTKVKYFRRTEDAAGIRAGAADVLLHTQLAGTRPDAPVIVEKQVVAGVFGGIVGGVFVDAATPPNVKTESLGTRQFDSVTADGTRTTMIIPAGAMGNVAPIEVVSERWFSQELQTAVMIVQRDPRSGETVYRLTNISRAEPPPDLFVVPPDYKLNR
ncbi:MAG TPA: hypothetical protein VFV95_05485 [Vicinamibacterales bacterium]|nr:hypothetical protein [Vicinamibacterales bacterium]